MFGWDKKHPKVCTEKDVRFFLLLCLGHDPEHKSDISRRVGAGCFALLKLMLASRPFVRGILEPLMLEKELAWTPYSPAQQALIKWGAKRHFGLRAIDANTHTNALQTVAASARLLNAFEAANNGYTAGWFAQAIANQAQSNTGGVRGDVERISADFCAGFAFDKKQPGTSLLLDFYINGCFIGASLADGMRPEIEEANPGFERSGFHHKFNLPPHLAALDQLVLSIYDNASGTPLCPPREFANMGARNQHHTLKLVAALADAKETASDGLRTAISDIEAALPALEQYAAFPLSNYSDFKRLYRTANAPVTHVQSSLDYSKCASLRKTDSTRLWFQYAAANRPDAVLFFSDHETLTPSGTIMPVYKPGFDYDELLARPDYARAFAVRPEALQKVGGSLEKPADLWLRIYETYGDHGFCHVPHILFTATPIDPIPEDTCAAVIRHFGRSEIAAAVNAPVPDKYAGPLAGGELGGQHVSWPLAEKAPLLAIIIPTRDTLKLTRNCVDSVRATLAHPGATEIIIVDNGSTDLDTKEWLHHADAMDGIRVLLHDEPFNWAEINNVAVTASTADYLLFLNNDTIALDYGWDTELRGHLNRPDVGAVGARLLFGDGTIQHAGVILNKVSLATHEGYGENPAEGGYNSRTKTPHICSAVTGAFLACRREVFERIGGFDAERFAVAFNDIDFCLNIMKAGLKTLYVPAITFRHLESKSRGYDALSLKKAERAHAEHMRMQEKWADTIQHDPWYPAAFLARGYAFSYLAAPQKGSVTRL